MTTHKNVYNPLISDMPQIRLVTIRPAEHMFETIECDSKPSSLDDRPRYEALSYVWGPPDDGYEILLNGHPFTVRKNLDHALRKLRYAKRPRIMWIDTLCINQEDKDERASQVLLMRKVYRSVTRVLIWFTDERGNSGAALKVLKSVREMTTSVFNRDVEPSQSDITKVRKLLNTDSLARESLPYVYEDFLAQEWWGRAWVIQEVAISSRAMVVVGTDELEWSSMIDTFALVLLSGVNPRVGRLLNSIHHNSILTSLTIHELRRMVEQASLPSLSTLVAANRHGSTDPRDQVYAYLGLAKSIDGPLLKPDYSDSKSPLAVFVDLIEHALKSEKCLDIIYMSQDPTLNDLPSWCPDWTQPPRSRWALGPESHSAPAPLVSNFALIGLDNAWRACGDTSPNASLVHMPPTLTCKGLLIDEIEVVGDPIGFDPAEHRGQFVINLHNWENLILKHFINDQKLEARPPNYIQRLRSGQQDHDII